ncbi:MAG: RNA polymerase sigma factor [Candidatus Limnocylindria bacterium]
MTEAVGLTSPRLVAAAVRGDVEAFAAIMAEHDNDMIRVAMVICGDQELARDAVQAAWHIAWQRLGSLRDADKLRAWLMSIAANEARQSIRATLRRQKREVQSTFFSPTSSTDPAHTIERLDLADLLQRLTPPERQLLALRYAAGLNSAEIARITRTTSSAIRGRIARLCERLRKEMEK